MQVFFKVSTYSEWQKYNNVFHLSHPTKANRTEPNWGVDKATGVLIVLLLDIVNKC